MPEIFRGHERHEQSNVHYTNRLMLLRETVAADDYEGQVGKHGVREIDANCQTRNKAAGAIYRGRIYH